MENFNSEKRISKIADNNIKKQNLHYEQMINELLEFLSKEHLDFYLKYSKSEVKNLKEKILKTFPLKDDYDFSYVANYLIKQIIGDYDEHTSIRFLNEDLQRFPIRARIIEGKMYVTDCLESLEFLKFKEITKVNGVDIKQLLKEIELCSCYFTQEWFEVSAEKFFYANNYLRSLPSISNYDDLIFTIDGKDINISKVKGHLENPVAENIKKTNMTYELHDDILKIIYNSCVEKKEGQMQRLIDEIRKVSNEYNISKYIVDLRGNQGGNSNIIKPLIKFLEGKEIITLVDKYVFSSGLFACNDLKNIGSKFVGTNIGTMYNRFGDCLHTNIGKLLLSCTFKYFYYDETKHEICSLDSKEDFVKFKNNKQNKKYFDKKPFLIDTYIEPTIEDYILKKDPILEYAEKSLKTCRKNNH